ncbi:MAG: hypothetical protein WBH28_21755 [Fuerstiella sp.]
MTVAKTGKLKSHRGHQPCCEYREDLVHELSKRMDTLRRCEQYVVNAEEYPLAVEFWQDVFEQEADNVKRLQELLETVTNQQGMRRESDLLCDSGELLSLASADFHRSTVCRIPVA